LDKFIPGKEPLVCIEKELGLVPEPVWEIRSTEKYLDPAGNQTKVPLFSSP
jgi:hypothetical protein